MNNRLYDSLYKSTKSSIQSPYGFELIIKLCDIIPDDVSSILDAGCGGGALLKSLNKLNRYELCGIDISESGVYNVNKELGLTAHLGSILEMVKFKDNSFDLVICSEVLEHLTETDINVAISELFRVSNKYVAITTPYMEDLNYHSVICNNCGAKYHIAGHIQSISEHFMVTKIFNFIDNIDIYYTGRQAIKSNLYLKLMNVLNYNFNHVDKVICSNCGELKKYSTRTMLANVINRIYGIINRLMLKKLPTGHNNIIFFCKKKAIND